MQQAFGHTHCITNDMALPQTLAAGRQSDHRVAAVYTHRGRGAEQPEPEFTDPQHLREDRQQGDGAAEEDGEEVHRERAEHDALAAHEADPGGEALEDRFGRARLQLLRRLQQAGGHQRTDEAA
jgi:hypothetical protein